MTVTLIRPKRVTFDRSAFGEGNLERLRGPVSRAAEHGEIFVYHNPVFLEELLRLNDQTELARNLSFYYSSSEQGSVCYSAFKVVERELAERISGEQAAFMTQSEKYAYVSSLKVGVNAGALSSHQTAPLHDQERFCS